jgi:hypothetical protein
MKLEQEDYPVLKVGPFSFSLRLAFSAQYILRRWGKDITNASNLELCAAMAGTIDESGKWKSRNFADAIELADLIEEGDPVPDFATLAGEAIKKAYPELEVSARQTPETIDAPGLPEMMTISSTSGPSQ